MVLFVGPEGKKEPHLAWVLPKADPGINVSARSLFGGDPRSRQTGKGKKDRERKAVNTGQERD